MRKNTSKVLTGFVKKHSDGFGFLIPNEKGQEDVYLPRSQMQGVMSNDELEVEVFVRRGRFYGQVKNIVKRTRDRVLGPFFRISKKLGCIKDEEGFFGDDIIFNCSEFTSLQNGDWIQVKILSYPGSKQGFRGKVEQVLGSFPDAWSDNMKMLREFNIPYAFRTKNLKNLSLKKEDLKNRNNLQSLPFVTIDGVTAKDFDDAIYVEKTRGGWVLFVSIADVDFYVKEGSPLDKEAYERGNSSYFPNFVAPMLPSYLSQDLCSLNPKVPRLTMTAELHFDQNGCRKKSLFYESVILSHARLTYGQVQEVIDGKLSKNLPSSVIKSLLNGFDLAKILLNQRLKDGSLNLDIPETEIRLDQKGYPIDIVPLKRLF